MASRIWTAIFTTFRGGAMVQPGPQHSPQAGKCGTDGAPGLRPQGTRTALYLQPDPGGQHSRSEFPLLAKRRGLPKGVPASSGLESGGGRALGPPRPMEPAPPLPKVQQVGRSRPAVGCRLPAAALGPLPCRPPAVARGPTKSHHYSGQASEKGPKRTRSEIALGMVFIHVDTVQILQFPFAAKSIKIIFI